MLAKPIGARCNLACDYCYYLDKTRLLGQPHGAAMSDAVLDSFVRQICETTLAPVIDFAWHGGEPTLAGIPFFQRAIELQHRYAGGRPVRNCLQTNGTLLNDEWGAFLAANGFLVGLSLDGPESITDAHRRNYAGAGAFANVMRGLRVLQRHGVEVNALAVVSRQSVAEPLKVYRFLKDCGLRHIQFIPVVERLAQDGSLAGPPGTELQGESLTMAPWSVPPERYGEFLVTIYDDWVRNDVGRVFVQLFDVAMYAWMGYKAPLCWFTEECGNALAMEHDGQIYSCDHYVYPEFRLGNLLQRPLADLARSEAQEAFGRAKAELPGYCRSCSVRFACHGECPKRRFAKSPKGEPGLNYLCPAYKRFFRHVDPTMKRMAKHLRAGRPVTRIMQDLARPGGLR